jgi:hypothetical protein
MNHLLAYALFNLGVTAFYENGPESAMPFYLECLDLRYKMGDKVGVVLLLKNLGETLVSAGEYKRAATIFGANDHLGNLFGLIQHQESKNTIEEQLQQIRGKIYKDEFETAWFLGTQMDLETVVTFILHETNT